MQLTRRESLCLLTAPLVSSLAFAQGNKNLNLIVGYPAGGAPDTVARAVAEGLRSQGYVAIVDNKAGAGGRMAIETFLRAPADGQNLLVLPSPNVTIYPHIYSNLRYKPADFAFVASIAEYSFGIAVAPNVPANTLAEFIAWAKANPDKATFGTPGAGSAMHFLGMQLAAFGKFSFQHVPYKGGAPALSDAMGGSIAAVITTLPNLLKAHAAKRIRILAVSDGQREQAIPDVPTFKEAGFPALTLSDRFLVACSAKTALEKQKELSAAIIAAAESPNVKKVLAAAEYTPAVLPPDAAASIVASDFDRWGKIVKATGYKAEE